MSIEMFDFKGHDVRVTVDDQGEPRWVASDVAKVLGYREAANMTRNIRDRHKGPQIVRTLGGEQWMTTLTEAGLYSAILKSRVEMAEEFQDWVTEEVLPSIRKHGGYISEHATEEQLEALQRELRRTKDELTESVRREDSSYGRWQEAQRELDSLRLVDEIREQQGLAVNVYDYILRRTGDHGFASKWTLSLANATGRDWPYVFSDGDGLRAHPSDLDDAWLRYGYGSKAVAHKRNPVPSVTEILKGRPAE